MLDGQHVFSPPFFLAASWLRPPSNTMYLGSPEVFTPNRTSSHSAFFVLHSNVSNKLADTPRYGIVGRNRPHYAVLSHSMRSDNSLKLKHHPITSDAQIVGFKTSTTRMYDSSSMNEKSGQTGRLGRDEACFTGQEATRGAGIELQRAPK